MKTKVKICCIGSTEEAKMAIDCGASALGFVGRMPSGPGIIPDDLILQIVQKVPPPIGTFLLTSETSARDIIEHHARTNTNTLQLVDELTEGSYQDLRMNLPVVKIVQVIHVTDEQSVQEALRASEFVDALLLDSGNPRLMVKELGGTGRVHNWKYSRTIVEQSRVPVFLAGGIHAGNVREAIDTVQPFGIDVCSGVRTDNKLDKSKLDELFKHMWD